MEKDVGAALECQNQNACNIKGKDEMRKLAARTDSNYFSDSVEFWYFVLSQCLGTERTNPF